MTHPLIMPRAVQMTLETSSSFLTSASIHILCFKLLVHITVSHCITFCSTTALVFWDPTNDDQHHARFVFVVNAWHSYGELKCCRWPSGCVCHSVKPLHPVPFKDARHHKRSPHQKRRVRLWSRQASYNLIHNKAKADQCVRRCARAKSMVTASSATLYAVKTFSDWRQ